MNERSRNISVRALVNDPDGLLLPGSLVKVAVPVSGAQIATLVPLTAVRRSAFGAHVFVLVPAEESARAPYRASQRPVVLGPQQGDLVIIVSGLKPGELVATDGAFKLREGVLVNPVSDTAGVNAIQGRLGGV